MMGMLPLDRAAAAEEIDLASDARVRAGAIGDHFGVDGEVLVVLEPANTTVRDGQSASPWGMLA